MRPFLFFTIGGAGATGPVSRKAAIRSLLLAKAFGDAAQASKLTREPFAWRKTSCSWRLSAAAASFAIAALASGETAMSVDEEFPLSPSRSSALNNRVYLGAMRAIGTALCAAAIAVGATFGSGSALFCKHESGKGHLVSKAEHASEEHGDWCSSTSAGGAQTAGGECDSCTDTELEPLKSLGDVAPTAERAIVKAPQAVDFAYVTVALVLLSPRSNPPAEPTRPPKWIPFTRDLYTETVQLLL